MKKKVIERIVRGSGAPNTQDIWLNDNLEMKVYENEQWKTIAGGSGSDGGSGSGCSCLSPMIVAGTLDENGNFNPEEGAVTWEEAHEQMFNGGLVYLANTVGGEPIVVFLATVANPKTIIAPTGDGAIFWDKPSDEPLM